MTTNNGPGSTSEQEQSWKGQNHQNLEDEIRSSIVKKIDSENQGATSKHLNSNEKQENQKHEQEYH